MHTRSKKLVSFALSYALAFSPLAPVNLAIAKEQAEQGAIELSGNESSDQAGQPAADAGDQAVTLGEESAPEAQPEETKKEEGKKEEAIELVDEAIKGKAEAAAQTQRMLSAQADGDQADGGAIDFVDAQVTPYHKDSSVDVTAKTKTMESSDPYVVREDVTSNDRITVKGNVILVICNGKTLTCPKGIEVAEGGHLMIYRQDGDNPGKLVCETSGSKVAAISVNEGSKLTINGCYVTATCKTNDGAGIGGDNGKSAGEITINAGEVTATSKMNGAGIGGGKLGSGGTITVNGGKVTATAKDEDGAGIGGGQEGASGAIAINGGTVKATGASHGAGIGGGDASACGDNDSITITSGTVDAKGGAYAAGIGAGGDSGYGTIKISGGTITAKGGTESAAIGSANKGNVESIEISGGDVIAIGASAAAGIGGGDGASCGGEGGRYGNITISDGAKVQAFGGTDGAGIGTGNESCNSDDRHNPGHITIKGGANVTAVGGCENVTIKDDRSVKWDGYDHEDEVPRVDATGTEVMPDPDYPSRLGAGGYAAGIGGGDDTPSGTIDILDAGTVVHAYGSKNGAGIGSGEDGGRYGRLEDVITIKGAEVTAVGGERAAGIGGGEESNFKSITIAEDANVTAVGGDYGAGIGTGDCSDTNDAWGSNNPDYNQIYISGPNTKVVAFGGTDAAGIGGGDEAPRINKIDISYVGQYANGEGYVQAIGQMSGSGIGGGCGPYNINDTESASHYYTFDEISINRATVMALGTFGAGIGTGGRDVRKDHPSNHSVGGTINVTDSFVTAISATGGAGIGGGIWGYVEHTNIKGGVTIAQGGAIWTDTNAVKGGQYLKTLQGQAEQGESSNIPEWVIKAMGGEVNDTYQPFVTEFLFLFRDMWTGGWHYIFDDFNNNAFQGAGIGGGFRSPGGEIKIEQGDADMDGKPDGGMVIAAAGMLPDGYGHSDRRAKAIGVGGHYAEKKDDGNYRWNINYAPKPRQYKVNEDHITKVDMYYDSAVVTAKLTCERPDGVVGPLDGAAYMVDPDMKAGYDPSAWAKNGNDDDTYSTVMLNNLAIVTPLTETFEVTFDKGAEDATGEMGTHPFTQQPTSPSMVLQNPRDPNTKLMAPMVPVLLPPCGYTRAGYEFAGWLDKNTGDVYQPADVETAMAMGTLAQASPDTDEFQAALAKVQAKCPFLNSDTTLYAQWRGEQVDVHYLVPVTDNDGAPVKVDGKQQYKSLDTTQVERGSKLQLLNPEGFGKLKFDRWTEGDADGPSGTVFYNGDETVTIGDELYLYATCNEQADGDVYCNVLFKSWDYDQHGLQKTMSVKSGTAFTLPGDLWSKKGFVLTEWEQLEVGKWVQNSDGEYTWSPNPALGGVEHPEFKGTGVIYQPGAQITPTYDYELNRGGFYFDAHYRRCEYTLSFDANAEGVEAPANEVLAYKYDDPDNEWDSTSVWDSVSKKVRTTLPSVEREGFKLVGWNTSADGSGTQYKPSQEVQNLLECKDGDGGTVTLYAQWAEDTGDSSTPSITFVKNARDGSDDEDYVQSVAEGAASVKLDECEFETPNGIFLGWATEPDGQVVYHDKEEIPAPEGDLTLYAKWQDGKWAKFTQSVELKDSLDFVFNVKELTDDPENYSIEYGPSGGEMQVTRLSDTSLNKFTIANCTAKQMSDTFDVIVTHYATPGDGDVIKEAQYSIKDYCKAAIKLAEGNESEQSKNLIALCQATLDYGSHAQQVLGYRMANLANDGVDFYSPDEIDVPQGTGYAVSTVSGSCPGITGQNVSLNSTSRTQFVVLFTHEPGADKADYTFTVDGKDYSAEDVIDRNNKFEVWIKGITAKELCVEHTVAVSKGGETYTYTASPATVMCKGAYAEKLSDGERLVYRYMFNFALAAQKYLVDKGE